jgi:hypothetical protein
MESLFLLLVLSQAFWISPKCLKLDALVLPIGWIESDGESEELIVCGASAFIPLGPIWLEKSRPGIIPANEILYKIE